MSPTATRKDRRQKEVVRILGSSHIRTQDELRRLLRSRGVEATQTTLSRDLGELGITKGGGVYRVPSGQRRGASMDVGPAVLEFEACGPHLVLVRTLAGQAQSVGVDVDARRDVAVAGTIAGDDTLLVATRHRADQKRVLRSLRSWYGVSPRRP